MHGETFSDPRFELEGEVVDERDVALVQIATKVGDKFTYEYDFGDGWSHEVRVKEILPLAAGADASRMQCVGGARACPPEDCGGARGYRELLLALQRPTHARHQELSEWLTGFRAERASFDARFEGPFDPDAFDLDTANKAVGKLTRRKLK